VTFSLDGYLLHELLHCCIQCGSNLESFGSGQYPEHFHVLWSSLCFHPKSKTITTAHYASLLQEPALTGFKLGRYLLKTDGSTRSAGTTTTYHRLICGGDPSCEVIWGWRYGPCRLRVNDDEIFAHLCNNSFSAFTYMFTNFQL